MSTTSHRLPSLAPPGAGIPVLERLIGGAIFSVRRRLGNRETWTAEFQREREKIALQYRSLDGSTLCTRILIPRLRGLEDSSRFWSVSMTLDHLRIVNDQIVRVIGSLTRGVVPEGRASTAAVKPRDDVSAAAAAEYEASCDRLLGLAAETTDLRTPLRYAHPWFGPLDAAGWHAMAAMHMGIHRAQIARIIALRSRA